MKFFKPRFWDKNQVSVYSIFLLPLSLLIQLFNKLKSFFIKGQKCSIPVICVGNIYLGGTGKTPICIELCNILKNLNKKVIFIRKKHNSYKDEKKLLEQYGVVYESNKRTNAIKNATQNKFEVAILDDGFQDFSVKKDLSVICFNEKQWIGNGLTIPSGPLRENISALSRANCVLINGSHNANVEKKILKKNKLIKIFYFKYMPINLDNFKDKKIVCFAGIGNPNNFFDLLKKNNVNILEEISFPDHHDYSKAELENLIKKIKEKDAFLLTTEKDYLRIDKEHRADINYLKIRTEIEKKDEFIEEIKKVI